MRTVVKSCHVSPYSAILVIWVGFFVVSGDGLYLFGVFFVQCFVLGFFVGVFLFCFVFLVCFCN